MEGMSSRTLRLHRQFYLIYPEIRQTMSAESPAGLLAYPIWQTVSAKSKDNLTSTIVRATSAQLTIPVQKFLDCLSFSHFAELVEINDPLKQVFYEIECIRGNWLVRALKRQITSLYFERSGLSSNKEKLAELVQKGAEQQDNTLVEYALAGMDNKLFVSKYQLELPRKEDLKRFLEEKLREVGNAQ